MTGSPTAVSDVDLKVYATAPRPYRQEEGQPQFRASFTEWNLSPEVPDDLFAFTPEEGAEKVPFAVPGVATPSPATGATEKEGQ